MGEYLFRRRKVKDTKKSNVYSQEKYKKKKKEKNDPCGTTQILRVKGKMWRLL